jgi:hypothetical protein
MKFDGKKSVSFVVPSNYHDTKNESDWKTADNVFMSWKSRELLERREIFRKCLWKIESDFSVAYTLKI